MRAQHDQIGAQFGSLIDDHFRHVLWLLGVNVRLHVHAIPRPALRERAQIFFGLAPAAEVRIPVNSRGRVLLDNVQQCDARAQALCQRVRVGHDRFGHF